MGRNNLHAVYNIDGVSLEHVTEEKDLGILVSSDLKVAKQCSCVVKSANRTLGLIKRTFTTRDSVTMLNLYKALVRPKLEYSMSAWRPHLKKDIELLEGVQRRATKLIYGLYNRTYEQRLQELKLTTLETRRLRGDLIEVFKIFKGFTDIDPSKFFVLSTSELRGHTYKLYKQRASLDICKYSFCHRVYS
jgi:hypothetical protein